MFNPKPYKGNDVIYVGNGDKLVIAHIGDTSVGGLNLKDILVVPQLKKNLILVSKIIADNLSTIEFTLCDFVIKDQSKRTIRKGHKEKQLYALDSSFHEALFAIRGEDLFSLWHQLLGHPNEKNTISKKVINVANRRIKHSICASCQVGKSCKQPFHLNKKISNFFYKRCIMISED